MDMAIQLAEKGVGRTHPNPRVGAVIVKNDKVVGRGWHCAAGSPHAEVLAIREAGVDTQDATLYVTLEPCNGTGRTPPCVEAIVQAGIVRVVYASSDPNPSMKGGADALRLKNIQVEESSRKDKADMLNHPFFHWLEHGLPWLTAKAAISMDGEMGRSNDRQEWLSGAESLRDVHCWRATQDALIVGKQTFVVDNPRLTVRGVDLPGNPPLRVMICHTAPALNPDAHFLSSEAPARFYVSSVDTHSKAWADTGVEVVQVESLTDMMRHLAKEGRLAIGVEGGSQLFSELLQQQLVNELRLYQTPHILVSGKTSLGIWQDAALASAGHATLLRDIERCRMGVDTRITGVMDYPKL